MSAPRCCDRPMIFVEISEVYDGALFLECESCGARAHRFAEGHYLHAKAQPYVAGREAGVRS